jgi:hypothetical protein
MIPEKLLEVLKQDGIVAIATLGQDGPHKSRHANYDGILSHHQIAIALENLTRLNAIFQQAQNCHYDNGCHHLH